MTQQPTGQQPETGSLISGPGDVWRIIRKQMWLVVACFVVIGLGGTTLLVVWHREWPYYRAEGSIQIEPGQRQQNRFDPGLAEYIPNQMYEQYMMTQVNRILGTDLLENALERIDESPEYGSQTMYAPPNRAMKLQEDLAVSYVPNTQYIRVSLLGRDPAQVKTIVLAVLHQYRYYVREQQQTAEDQRLEELRQTVQQLEGDLEEKLAAMTRRRAGIGATVLRGGESDTHVRVRTLQQVLSQAEAELAGAQAAWQAFQDMQQQAEEDPEFSIIQAVPEVTEMLRRDRSLNDMVGQVSAIAQELEAMKQRLGPQHEAVQRLQVQYDEAQEGLQRERQQILAEIVAQYEAQIRNDRARAQQTLSQIQALYADAKDEVNRINDRIAEYQALDAEYEQITERLRNFREELQNQRVQANLTRQNVSILQEPERPVEAAQPRLPLYVPAVVLFSLLLGGGLAILIEFMDVRLRTPAEVARKVGVPILGTIPDLTEDERLSPDTDVARVSHVAPQSLIAEAFRQFRTNLLFASDQPLRSLLITSPHPGDGKTSAAVNLAVTLARSGSRTLLVEANFRRPALAKVFDVPDQVGLSNVLVGLSPVEEAIQTTRIENLDVMPGGGRPPSPADLLGSENMRQLLDEQAANYDRIILDGAPTLVVADVHLLAEAVDGTILVFRAGENTRGVAQRAARQLVDLRARILGAVLNGVKATRGGYFREAYRAYYDYSGSEARAVIARETPHEYTPPASQAAEPVEPEKDMTTGELTPEDIEILEPDTEPPEGEPPAEEPGEDKNA